jgi:hypothetical protein
MCVIAVKAKGVNPPTEANMKSMFDYNDDGAGFAYVLDNRVIVEKGLMEWKDFERAYALFEKRLRTAGKDIVEVPILFHFRIGTHGPNSVGLTHPFPISDKFKHLSALDYSADLVMAHNGIIHSVTPRSGWSDTQQYVSDILLPMAKSNRAFYKDKHMKQIIDNTINGSRFVFLDKDGNFEFVGDWKESDDKDLKGIKYSNLNHEAPAYSFRSYYDYSYAPSATYKKQMVPMKKLPVDSQMYMEKDIDSQWNVKNGAKPRIITKNDNIYIDEYGQPYQESGDGSLFPMMSYVMVFEPNDLVPSAAMPSDKKMEAYVYEYSYSYH